MKAFNKKKFHFSIFSESGFQDRVGIKKVVALHLGVDHFSQSIR